MISNQKVCGLIGLATRAGKIVFGTEACQTAIKKHKVKLILVAIDAADRTKKNFINLCDEYNLQMIEILNTEELSKCIGKENKVVVGINDINFSNAILKIVNGGEVIG